MKKTAQAHQMLIQSGTKSTFHIMLLQ